MGRYSFLGCDPLWILEARENRTTQTHRDGSVVFEGDPFTALTYCLKSFHPVVIPAAAWDWGVVWVLGL